MSTVSSISSNSNLYQFLQNLQQSSGISSATGGGSGVQGAHHHHKHGGGGGSGGLMSQVQNAVTSALQSAKSSGSTTDPNQIVQNAIAQVLQNDSTAATAGSSTTAATAGAATAGTTAASSPQAFFQTLQASGVSPQQFLSDFMAALQSTQSSQLNSGSLTGSLVNATA
jgi:hypothetical protein